jgi:hypothetical protein
MSRNNIIKEAIADAKATREAALENAKSMIVDAFTPALKGKISENLENSASKTIAEGGDQPASYDGGHPSQSGEDMLNKGDGSAVYEDDDTNESSEDVSEAGDSVDEDVYEIALAEDDDDDDEYEDESREERADVDKYEYEQGKDAGEDESEMYEAKKVNAYVNKLHTEIKAYRKAIKQLQNEFTDVNLFNAKLIYANKVLRTPGLTKDQKHGIVERFDDASTINEVKIIFKSLTEGVKIGAAVKKSPARKSVMSSVSKGNNNSINEEFERLQELSGLLKD